MARKLWKLFQDLLKKKALYMQSLLNRKGEVEASTSDLQNAGQNCRFYWRFIREAAVSVFDVYGNTGGEEDLDVEDVGGDYGLVISLGHICPDGCAFRFWRTNTTILYSLPASLCDLELVNPSDLSTDVAMHLDCPPSFMRRFLRNFDVVVLNTGHHWSRGKLNANRWVMYVDGKPNNDKNPATIWNAKNFTVHSIARWLDSQLPAHPRLKAFFRTSSPRQFFHGDWNTGCSSDNTSPMSKGSSILQDRSSVLVVDSIVWVTKVKILDITALLELRDEGHISRYSAKSNDGIQDCLNWCLPGIPDNWSEFLCEQI